MTENLTVSVAEFRRWTEEQWTAACRRMNPYYGTKVNDGHIPVECTRADCTGCMFCEGGLFACEVCGSFEGATTTFCPGQPMTKAEADAVYTGDLDYRDDQWVDGPSTQTPALFARARLVLA